MKHLKIKVLLESDKLCFCDIMLSESETLSRLHRLILDSFQFEGKQMASFYQTNEDYDVLEEFPYAAIDPNYAGKLMEDVQLGEFISSVGDQLLYVYDYLNEWKFTLECVELDETKSEAEPPSLIKQVGRLPKEEDRDISGEDAESILMNALLGDELNDEFKDEDDWESDSFDSIDDYEEYL